MTPIAAQVSITEIIPMLTAIGNRQWEQFKQLEADFVSQYGVEVWQEVFNFRLKLALDKDSDRWLQILGFDLVARLLPGSESQRMIALLMAQKLVYLYQNQLKRLLVRA